MNSKTIITLVGIIIGIVTIVIIMPSVIKPVHENDDDQHITKGSISPSMSNFTLSVNYTSLQLLDYCSQNDSQVYNDDCLRGLWDVNDQCKNGNFSSTNSVCSDSRLGQFEGKVNVYMQDLGNSLTKIVDSCMITNVKDEIQSCLVTIERIKNDCTEYHFYSLTNICKDSRLDQFELKYKDVS